MLSELWPFENFGILNLSELFKLGAWNLVSWLDKLPD